MKGEKGKVKWQDLEEKVVVMGPSRYSRIKHVALEKLEANLETTTAGERSSVTALTRTITELTTQVSSLISQTVMASQTIIALSVRVTTAPNNKNGTNNEKNRRD